MSILNFENRTPRTMRAMYEYMVDYRKTDSEGVFGLGVNAYRAVEEMEFVQRVYFRDYIKHPYIQMIFAFDMGVLLDMASMRRICMEIGECLLLDERQVLGAIHYKNTDKVHCHYMINYVGMKGQVYRQEMSVIFFKDRVNGILAKNGLKLIDYYGRDMMAIGY